MIQPGLQKKCYSSRVSEFGAGVPDTSCEPVLAPPREASRRHTPRDRIFAALEVVICSGFPTQLTLIYFFARMGLSPADGRLSIGFVATVLLLDAALVVVLVLVLLRLHDEKPRDLFLGRRSVGREALIGLPLTIAAFGLVMVVLRLTQWIAPWLHNVPQNPLEQLIRSSRDAAIFAVVGTLAGGLREEVQRAFILRRFAQYLGGARVGLLLSSAAFGAGHLVQGWDAAVTTAALGAFWGTVYLSRGSIVAPVVSHSGFNTAEILRFTIWRA
jgi:membrane protease YdiL (CAAX protease family)